MSLLVVLCAMAVTGSASARAEDRYAIVVGSNRGEPDEALLRFAERDAERVAEVLVRLGGVAPEDLLLMRSPRRDALAKALDAFRMRIRDGGRGATVFVYYSGHADAGALHLGAEAFAFRDLKAAVAALGASASVFVLDACRSGGILKKGGKPVAAFDFEVQDLVATEGVAFITSSAENEDAQESDRLEGGVFTHHLLTGLLGAADASGDLRVSLAEAYRYAYEQTVAATSTSAIVQHPTYRFDVSGRDEIVVTRVGLEGQERGLLAFTSAGRWLVLAGDGRRVVAELGASPGASLLLEPGRYVVRRREASAVFEANVEVHAGVRTEVDAGGLERVAFRHAVRKGGYGLVARRALSLGADGEVAGALFGDGVMGFGALALQADWADIAFRARLRFGLSEPDATLATTQTFLGVDAGIFHLFDVGRHGVGFGLRAGIDWLAQRFTTTGVAPDVDQVVGRVAPLARLELALGGSVALQLDAGLEVYVLEVAGKGRTAVEARVLPTVALGLGFALW